MTQSDIGIVELKACPFCGTEAQRVVFGKGQSNERHGVRCADLTCGGMVRLGTQPGESEALWNTRDPIITEMVEALEGAADAMTCRRDDDAHYCPNCDNSLHEARDKVRTTLAKVRSK